MKNYRVQGSCRLCKFSRYGRLKFYCVSEDIAEGAKPIISDEWMKQNKPKIINLSMGICDEFTSKVDL